MTNMLIAYRNHVDAGTASGGAWETTLPLENLKDQQLTKVARSAGLALSDTRFDWDMGSGKPVSFISLLRHNMTQSAVWRVRLAGDAAFNNSVYDSGWQEVWPSVMPFGTGVWGEFTWAGKLDEAEASTYGISAYQVFETPVQARYLRIEFDDPDNADGYIQVGRLIAAPAWQPSINLQHGWSIEQVDTSDVIRSKGGQSYVNSLAKYRRLRFRLDHLSRNEMFGNAYELERLKGRGGDVIVMIDPGDALHLHRQSVYGALAESTAITNAQPFLFSKEFVIEELI